MAQKVRAKIVLQDRDSLLYLRAAGEWTADVCDAVTFEHVTDANTFARRCKPAMLDIVMNFGDPQYDVRLPASG